MAEAAQEHEHHDGEAHDGHAAESHAAHSAEGHGHEDHGGGDPMHHIMDKVLLGVGTDGKIHWKPYGDHGHVQAGYTVQKIGPLKLEFTKHMTGLTFIAVVLALIITSVARRVAENVARNQAPKGALANTVEAFMLFVRDELVIPTGGHHVAPYTPLFLTYFFFIVSCNLAGMIPEFGGTTGNIAVTLFLGGSVWVLLTILGMANQGVGAYFMHLVPPGTPWWLCPLMFVLEFVGPLIKCVVLCVRLFANMIAGHLIISNVLALGVIGGALPTGLAIVMLFVGVPLALGISMLEILVCFIQAYVFTMLSIIFVGAAVHPEH